MEPHDESIEEGSTTTGLSYFQIYIKSYYAYAARRRRRRDPVRDG